MAKPDFTLHRQRLLALRARLLGDVNQMTDNALKEAKSTRMPTTWPSLAVATLSRNSR